MKNYQKNILKPLIKNIQNNKPSITWFCFKEINIVQCTTKKYGV